MDLSIIYHDAAAFVWRQSGLTDSTLHVYIGLAFMLLVSLISGRPLHSLAPLAFVALAEAGNELMDYYFYGYWRSDTFSDIAHTLFWPLAIFATIHIRRALHGKPGRFSRRLTRKRRSPQRGDAPNSDPDMATRR